ncbi:MAG: helix-turn-helix domain-containing protein [Bacteroidia bacterium]
MLTYPEHISKPTKEEQRAAIASYSALEAAIAQLSEKNPEIEIEETGDKIRVPVSALKLLAKILEVTSQGKPISIVPLETEMTTQAAADLIGCSRPHLVKLLESGEIPFTKVGKHRRVKFEEIMAYKKRMKAQQEQLLIQIMNADEEDGLYDS